DPRRQLEIEHSQRAAPGLARLLGRPGTNHRLSHRALRGVTMKFTPHTFGILLRVAFLAAGAAFRTLRAPEEKADAPPPAQTQPRDDTTTIQDDPTVAPDPKQSADNNVSFPVDI